MTVDMLHDARRSLLTAQGQLLYDYKSCSLRWPAMNAAAAQDAITRAHKALIPAAYALGEKFGEIFCKAWDDGVDRINESQVKPSTTPTPKTRPTLRRA